MKINIVKNFNIDFKKTIIYSIFFLTIFFINYHSLHIVYHGSRTTHIFLISLSAVHSLISVFLIHFFFIKDNFYFLNIFNFSKIYFLISKFKKDLFLGFSLIILSFLVAYLYTSFIEKNNLLQLSYDPTAKLPKSLIPFKKEFSSFLFSLSILFSYLIFRLFKINKLFSFILCAIFLTSPIHLYNLFPSPFRDYFSKTILLFMILSSFIIIYKKIDFNILKILILISTIVLSYGLYIRQDLIIILFPFILLIIFSLFKNKLICKKNSFYIIFSLIIILVPQYLRLTGTIGNVIGGLITATEGGFSLDRPLYDFGYCFNDNYLWLISIIDSEIFSKILLNFPADFITKILNSISRVLNLSNESLLPMPGVENDYIINFYESRALLLNIFKDEVIFFIFAYFLFYLFYKNFTSGIISSLIIFILLSYPILNFYVRHFFYLEVIPLLSIGVFFQSISNFTFNYKKNTRLFNFIRIRNLLILFFFILISCFFIFKISMVYQKYNFEKILFELNNLTKEELNISEKNKENSTLFKIDTEKLFENKVYPPNVVGLTGNVEHIILEFNFDYCGLQTVWPTLKYKNNNLKKYSHYMNYDRTVKIDKTDLLSKISLIIFPVYREVSLIDRNKEIAPENINAQVEFEGVEFNNLEKECFSKMYKVINYPQNLPKSLSIFGYDQKPYFQFSKKINLYTIPKNLKKYVGDKTEGYFFKNIDNSIIDYKNKDLNIEIFPSKFVTNAGSISNNYCPPRDAIEKNTRVAYKIVKDFYFLKFLPCTNENDLLWTKKINKNKGDIFVLEGEIINGGLRAGFIDSKEKNRAYVQIEKKGNFKISLEIPASGNYNFGISNFTNLYSYKENHFIIKKVGFLVKN